MSDHHQHGAAGAAHHVKKGKKKEKKTEDEDVEEEEWVDEGDEDGVEGAPMVFDLGALKQQIDRLVAQQGLGQSTLMVSVRSSGDMITLKI